MTEPTPPRPPQRDDFSRSEELTRQHRERLAASTQRRNVPDAAGLARRRTLLRWAKWVLPSTALLLLASIAVWPELDRLMNANNAILRDMAKVKVESGKLVGATYRGVDDHNRPFMITAESAHQITPERMNLVAPTADVLSQGNDWMMVRAYKGVYMQHDDMLDLTGEVTLYRDDGLMMRSPVADINLKSGIIASNSWVRAEGPFGVLDAKSYLLSQHDGVAQFRGPGRLILNDDHSSHPQEGKAS
ncbi:MAG: LPS export ABC transporter periplasmic protein LptC [Acetobacter orientalis]|uniref:LPS export ABC transporter periplasmic protein LptC n=1 Tax=Acetobacter orientalis TaxID=146474 RepID=UPI0039E8788A